MKKKNHITNNTLIITLGCLGFFGCRNTSVEADKQKVIDKQEYIVEQKVDSLLALKTLQEKPNAFLALWFTNSEMRDGIAEVVFEEYNFTSKLRNSPLHKIGYRLNY